MGKSAADQGFSWVAVDERGFYAQLSKVFASNPADFRGIMPPVPLPRGLQRMLAPVIVDWRKGGRGARGSIARIGSQGVEAKPIRGRLESGFDGSRAIAELAQRRARVGLVVSLTLFASLLAWLAPASSDGDQVTSLTGNVLETSNIQLAGPPTGQAGFSVAPGGDINGDGRPDVIVGAPFTSNGRRSDAGAVFVLFGRQKRGSWTSPRCVQPQDSVWTAHTRVTLPDIR